jgi:electron transfer flavoprotein beta subunit
LKKLILCIKEVPDTDKIEIDYENGLLKRENARMVINPCDETPLKWALELKKKRNFHTSVVSMGPSGAWKSIDYCLSLGIDRGYLISDKGFGGSDTLATSKVLSSFISRMGVDLILCGETASDGETGQVPGQIAELMGISSYSRVKKVRVEGEKVLVDQQIDGLKTYEDYFPLMLSFERKDAPLFLFPAAENFFRKREIPVLNHESLEISLTETGLKGSPTQVIKVETPRWPGKRKEVHPFKKEWIKKVAEEIGKIALK